MKTDQPVTILFHPLEKMVTVPAGTLILDAINRAGIRFSAVCGGKGLCGKCRIILNSGEYTEDFRDHTISLPAEERDKGYRLACGTRVHSDAEITIPVESRIENPQILLAGEWLNSGCAPSVSSCELEVISTGNGTIFGPSIRCMGDTGTRPAIHPDLLPEIRTRTGRLTAVMTSSAGETEVIAVHDGSAGRYYGIALDLGTTTVAGILADITTGEMIATASALNRQITYGEELISRIAHGKKEKGLFELQSAALASINEVISSLLATGNIRSEEVYDICVGGNTVMCYLLAGYDPGPLEYTDTLINRKPIVLRAGIAGIQSHSRAYVWCLPAVSRFVGGDAIGDILASGLTSTEEISLLIDLGTNGEIILGNGSWLVSTSCASGPAFEGSGLSSGMRGMMGAVDHVRIDPETGEISYTVIGGGKPAGICGSGVIDAAAAMAAAGILDFSGKLVSGTPGVREGRDGPEFLLVSRDKTATARDICITYGDMAYLMDTKAAILGAISVLCNKYRVRPADIRHLYLAGAFGSFSSIDQLISFGLLPELPATEVHMIGNGSLAGAYAALLSSKTRSDAEKIAAMMGYIDLLVDTEFIDEYWAALRIPGKEELFPAYYAKIRGEQKVYDTGI